ncbi:MAG: S41 family peptidase [Bacteroidota bacterium]
MRLKLTFLTLLAVIGMGLSHAQSEGFEELKSLELMDQIYEHLDLYFVDEIPHGKLSKTAIDAMLNELDPYTVFYHEANIEDYRLMTTGQYGGIGASLGEIGEYTYITDINENSPAQKGGLLAGDKILRVDNKSVLQKTTDEISNALKGPKGTSVAIEVQRGDKSIILNLTRDEIKIPDIPFAGMIDETTGYISLSSFTQTAAEEVKKNILDLQAKGMKKLIFDLRGNGGGLLMEAVKIVGFFVPKGQEVVSTKGRSKQENMVYKTQENPIAENLPLVVLIDDHSASASEIVAGALQDLDRAAILGSTSYGKGLVQRTFDLKYGSKMKLTIAKYYTPSGRCVQRLDYYDNNSGSSPKEIPDSLLQQFSTKNGRKVIDGRGIEPDIEIIDSVMSSFTKALVRQHMIFHFATQYHSTHESIATPDKFELSEEDYTRFIAFVQTQNFTFNSYESTLLDQLKKSLQEKNEYAKVSKNFEALQEELSLPMSYFFVINKTEISALLASEIVGRFFYEKGKNQYGFRNNRVLTKALEVLNNDNEYRTLLHIK